MQPPRTRLLCRAHNRFTPSIVLWQHFVIPAQHSLKQQRLSSSATEAVVHHGTQDENSVFTKAPSSPDRLEPLAANTARQKSIVRRQLSSKEGMFRQILSDKKTLRKVTVHGSPDWRKSHGENPTPNERTENLLNETKAAFNDVQDYKGVVVKPQVNPYPIKESQLPWCLEQEERTMAGMDRLSIEIERFYEFAKPNRLETIARRHVIEQVRDSVRKRLPGHVLEIFGSESTGMALATSDIDFRLVPQSHLSDSANVNMPPKTTKRHKVLDDLYKLNRHFLHESRRYLMPIIRHARYPLVSLQDRVSGIDLQIVASNDTSSQRAIMFDYMEQYPYLRSVYYVIKTTFDIRGLSDVFRGGLGSYSLFMMVVASIRHKPHPRTDAAGALINFLKFWSNFDTTKHTISIEPVCLYPKGSQVIMSVKVKAKLEGGKTKSLPPYMLSLRDPADETNDLGRKGIAIKHIQTTLASLFRGSLADIRANMRPSLLGPLVGPSYMLNADRRAALEKYGKQLLTNLEAGHGGEVTIPEVLEEAEDETMMMLTREEGEQDQLARQELNKESQRLAEEESKLIRLEVERTSASEHGEVMANILGMPSVGVEADTRDSSTIEQSSPDGAASVEKNGVEAGEKDSSTVEQSSLAGPGTP